MRPLDQLTDAELVLEGEVAATRQRALRDERLVLLERLAQDLRVLLASPQAAQLHLVPGMTALSGRLGQLDANGEGQGLLASRLAAVLSEMEARLEKRKPRGEN